MKIIFNQTREFFSLMIVLAFALASCTSDDTNEITPADFSDVLTNIGQNVITATYIDLNAEAQELTSAVQALNDSRTADKLNDAQNAWRAARRPWEMSEGFLFGPVDTKGLDPSLDSWPVDIIDLNAVLASNTALTEAAIFSLKETERGFHTIEYLLWGSPNTTKTVTDFTDREFEYLIAAAQALNTNTQTLADSWEVSGDNFVANLINAGGSNSIYISQKAALEELVDGLITIADEVANGKIEAPFANEDLSQEESQFSHNSKKDFADNIRSIEHIYIGSYANSSGQGLSDVVVGINAILDARLKAEITAAINTIESIPGTFSTAIFDNKAAVSAAQTAVRTVQATLEEDIKPAISNL